MMAFLTTSNLTNGYAVDDASSTDLLTLAMEVVGLAAGIQTLLASQNLAAPTFSINSAELPDTPEHMGRAAS